MDLMDKSDKEILHIATPIMDDLMQGSTDVDHAKHTLHHTERAKKFITKEELERQCKEYQAKFGFFSDREFMGVTRHNDYVNIAWKQKMTNSPNEFLAVLSLVQIDQNYLVDRCWVDLWEPKGRDFQKLTQLPLLILNQILNRITIQSL